MGFPNENAVYANVRKGRLVVKRDGKTTAYPYFHGTLKEIKIVTDDYEGAEYEKVLLTMVDGDDEVIIAFRLEGWYSQGFFSRFHGIKLNQSFSLGVMPSKQNEKMSFCWVKQGVAIKKDDNFPGPDKVMVNNKPMADWTKFVLAVKDMVENRRLEVSVADLPDGPPEYDVSDIPPEAEDTSFM